MQIQAAERIEQGIGNNEAYSTAEAPIENVPDDSTKTVQTAKFEPYKGKIRRSGTGGIYELNDHLYEGRYTPTNAHGKRESHNVYASTREECEKLLANMIQAVRQQIKEEKEQLKLQKIV